MTPVPRSATARASRLGPARPTRRRTRRLIPDPATTEVPAQLREEIEAAMARYPDRRSAAIPALHAAQRAARLVLAARRSSRSRA